MLLRYDCKTLQSYVRKVETVRRPITWNGIIRQIIKVKISYIDNWLELEIYLKWGKSHKSDYKMYLKSVMQLWCRLAISFLQFGLDVTIFIFPLFTSPASYHWPGINFGISLILSDYRFFYQIGLIFDRCNFPTWKPSRFIFKSRSLPELPITITDGIYLPFTFWPTLWNRFA